MSILTNFLKLFKYDPVADKDSTFNINKALNENWDKIDTKVEEISLSIDNIEVPVISVNSKTGAVVLNAADVGAETPTGAQSKVNALAGDGNTKTVKQLDNELGSHKADNVQQFANVEYNIYQLYLQNYYDGKYLYKRGLFFDGFIDNSVIDSENSLVLVDTTNKILSGYAEGYISQKERNTQIRFGDIWTKQGQTFKVKNNILLKSIELYLLRVGSPTDNVVCKLYNTVNGLPTTEIATSSTVIQGSTITTGTASYSFQFEQPLLPGDYAFAVERTGSVNSSNYYEIRFNSLGTYPEGTRVDLQSQWSIPNQSHDLWFNISAAINQQNLVYQCLEQIFSQDMKDAVLYVKSKTTNGCFISAYMAIYNDAEVFEPMALESTRDLGDGYQEDKFVFSTETTGNKAKVRIALNRPDTVTQFEVNEYGCILGVS